MWNSLFQISVYFRQQWRQENFSHSAPFYFGWWFLFYDQMEIVLLAQNHIIHIKALKADDDRNHTVKKVLLFCMKIDSRSSTVEENEFYWKQITDWLDGDLESKMISSSLFRKSSEFLTNMRGPKFAEFLIATTKIYH